MSNVPQIRMMAPVHVVQRTGDEETYRITGYATTFEPYYYFTDYAGNEIYESFTRECFNDVDINKDVILQFDHAGRVFARTTNGSLTLTLDDHGLRIDGDLGRTELARQLYEDIAAGMITKMSWRFAYRKDPSYNYETHTLEWPAGSISRIYDVSAVSIPADDDTSISARSDAAAGEWVAQLLRTAQDEAKRDADIKTRMRMRRENEKRR